MPGGGNKKKPPGTPVKKRAPLRAALSPAAERRAQKALEREAAAWRRRTTVAIGVFVGLALFILALVLGQWLAYQ